MNRNVKAFHCCDYAANWLLMARIKSIVLHKLGPEMGVLEQCWELVRKNNCSTKGEILLLRSAKNLLHNQWNYMKSIHLFDLQFGVVCVSDLIMYLMCHWMWVLMQ